MWVAKSFEEMKALAKEFAQVYNENSLVHTMYPNLPIHVGWVGEAALYHLMGVPAPANTKHMLVLFMQDPWMVAFDSTRKAIGDAIIHGHADMHSLRPRVYAHGAPHENFYHWDKEDVTYGVGTVRSLSNFQYGFYTMDASRAEVQLKEKALENIGFKKYVDQGIIQTPALMNMFEAATQAMNDGIEDKKNKAFRDIVHVLVSYKSAISIKKYQGKSVSFEFFTAVALRNLLSLENFKPLLSRLKNYLIEHCKNEFPTNDALNAHLRNIAISVLSEVKDYIIEDLLQKNHKLTGEVGQLAGQQALLDKANQQVDSLKDRLSNIQSDAEEIKAKSIIEKNELLNKIRMLENKISELNKVKLENIELGYKADHLANEKNGLIETLKEALNVNEKQELEIKSLSQKNHSPEKEIGYNKGALKMKDNEINMLRLNFDRLQKKYAHDIQVREERIQGLLTLASDRFSTEHHAWNEKRSALSAEFSYVSPSSRENLIEECATVIACAENISLSDNIDHSVFQTKFIRMNVAPSEDIGRDDFKTEMTRVVMREEKAAAVTNPAPSKTEMHVFSVEENRIIFIIKTLMQMLEIRHDMSFDFPGKDHINNLNQVFALFIAIDSDEKQKQVIKGLAILHQSLMSAKGQIHQDQFLLKFSAELSLCFSELDVTLGNAVHVAIQYINLFEKLLFSKMLMLPDSHSSYSHYEKLNKILAVWETNKLFVKRMSEVSVRIDNLVMLYVKHAQVMRNVKTVDVSFLNRFFAQYHGIGVENTFERDLAINLALSWGTLKALKINAHEIEAFYVHAALRVQMDETTSAATQHTCLHHHSHAKQAQSSQSLMNQELINFIVNKAGEFLIDFYNQNKKSAEFTYHLTESALSAYMGYKQAISSNSKADTKASLMHAFTIVASKCSTNLGINAEKLYRYSISILFNSIDDTIARVKKNIFDAWITENKFFIEMPGEDALLAQNRAIFMKLQASASEACAEGSHSVYALYSFFSCFMNPGFRKTLFIDKGFLESLTPLCSNASVNEIVRRPECATQMMQDAIEQFKETNPICMSEKERKNDNVVRNLLLLIMNEYVLTNNALSKEAVVALISMTKSFELPETLENHKNNNRAK